MPNRRNDEKRKDNTSGYKGVSWDKKSNKWRSQIWVGKKYIHLGYYNSPEDAYEAYTNFLQGNFPEAIASPKLTTQEYKKLWRESNKEKVIEYNACYREKNKERLSARDKQWKWDLKLEIIEEYGGKCECCAETKVEFLTIDHTNGGGGLQRKTLGGGYRFYVWLKKNNFPKDEYRLLCFNCNCAIGFFGYCPHQKTED